MGELRQQPVDEGPEALLVGVLREALNDGYGLGMALGAALLLGAVLVALVVLPRRAAATPPAEEAAQPGYAVAGNA